MRRPRFTIRGMMIVVAIAAFVLAMLRYPTPLWASTTFTLTIGLLLFSIPGIAYRRGRKRAFWVGFAVFGWGHFLWSSMLGFRRGDSYLLTDLVAYLLTALSSDQSSGVDYALMRIFNTSPGPRGEFSIVSMLSLMSLGIAYVGGIAIARTFGREDRDSSKDAAPSEAIP